MQFDKNIRPPNARTCCDDKSHFTPKTFLNFLRHRFHFVYWNVYKYLSSSGLSSSILPAEFLLWSSCQRFFQLFGCCPVLAQEHHCPAVWGASWSVCRGQNHAMPSLNWHEISENINLLYCTSTLVASRNVKQCETPKWQEIFIIMYICFNFYILHLTKKKYRTD